MLFVVVVVGWFDFNNSHSWWRVCIVYLGLFTLIDFWI